MNSANAFSYAISGSFTEDQISKYSDYVAQSTAALQGAGGWLAQQANKTADQFTKFFNSRAWEMGKRLLGSSDGDYVGRFDIGYLGSISGLQGAQGRMQDVIMAHPGLMQLYLDKEICGFNGEFTNWSQGLKEENLTYRGMWSGVMNLDKVNDVNVLRHTHFNDSIGGKFSFREKVNAHKTHAAIDHHLLTTMFDLTSADNDRMKKHQSVEE